jgi:DNA-binding response OmpR family regulator
MKYQLLLAEPSQTIRKAVEIALLRESCTIVAVDKGSSALEKAKAHAIDVAIVAVSLPDGDGYTVCQALKKFAMPVLLLGSTDPARLKSCNADKELAKPFDTEALLSSVQELVKNKQQAKERSDMHEDPFDIEIEVDTPEIAIATAAPSVNSLDEETLRRITREVVEQIAWEVVPKLAESILREQLEKKS